LAQKSKTKVHRSRQPHHFIIMLFLAEHRWFATNNLTETKEVEMSAYTDWATDLFITEAEQMGHMPELLKILREESNEQWIRRVMPWLNQLGIDFISKTGTALYFYNMGEEAVLIFNTLKERLTTEVSRSSNPPAET
jgi:hypothetical protein